MLRKVIEDVLKVQLQEVKDGIKTLDERITKMEVSLPIASSSKLL